MRYLADPKHGEGVDARGTMYPTTMDVYMPDSTMDIIAYHPDSD